MVVTWHLDQYVHPLGKAFNPVLHCVVVYQLKGLHGILKLLHLRLCPAPACLVLVLATHSWCCSEGEGGSAGKTACPFGKLGCFSPFNNAPDVHWETRENLHLGKGIHRE